MSKKRKAKYIAVFASGAEVALANVKGYTQDEAFALYMGKMEELYGYVPQTYYFGLGEYADNLMPSILPRVFGNVTIN